LGELLTSPMALLEGLGRSTHSQGGERS
jgi:hypothetical protein